MNLKSFAATVVAFLAAVVLVSGHTAQSITVYDSGDNSELVSSIPVASGAYQFQTVYSIPLGDLHVGDTLLIQTEMETTNDLGYNVMIASYVLLGDSPTATKGIEMTERNGYNVSANMHHGTMVKVGSYPVTEDLTNQYANVVLYAASTRATATSTIAVEQDYGRLIITKITG